ncbi:MAG: septum formation family protein [Microthrixaceae bacterium]|nr:septum formation family protein [Microthrixaceae bacterium]
MPPRATPEAAGWAAGGGSRWPACPGASGGGGNKALLVVLGVVGAVLVLSVIAIVLVTVLGSDSDDAATVDRTTLTLSIPDFDAGPTTTDDVSPGDSALNPPTTAAPGGDSIDVFELAVGDCFDVSGSGNISDVEGFDCDQPHDNEVFAVFDIAGGPDAPFPGTPAVEQEAQARCTGTLWTDYVGVPFRQSEFTATSINPTQQTWENLDDREVICVAQSGDGQPLTSSVRGANR